MIKPGSNERRSVFRASLSIKILATLLSGILMIIAASGWLIVYNGLQGLSERLDMVRTERGSQISDVTSNIRQLDQKLEVVATQIQRVENLARANAQNMESGNRRLNELEDAILRTREDMEKNEPMP